MSELRSLLIEAGADSVQFLSNIARTQWVSGSNLQDDVNGMLAQGWALLAAGMNPYGEPTWLLGLPYAVLRGEEQQ